MISVIVVPSKDNWYKNVLYHHAIRPLHVRDHDNPTRVEMAPGETDRLARSHTHPLGEMGFLSVPVGLAGQNVQDISIL